MNSNFTNNKIIRETGFGLTAAALTGAYAVCTAAAVGQSLFAALLCCTVCFILSLKIKDGVFAPYVYMLVPVLFIFSVASPVAGHIAVGLGGMVFLILQKTVKALKIPSPVAAGASVGLALAVTVLLTNHYFGIGAFGDTPLEMLKNYRYLGFHPLFRGLLYGTVTLFTMITYPFKFKKLNKYLPAEFITLFVPFILNLFLNPVKELTTINEALCLTSDTSLSEFLGAFSVEQMPNIIKTALAIGLLLLGSFSLKDDKNAVAFGTANTLSGLVSGIPVKKYNIRGYGKIAAAVALFITAVLMLLLPDAFSRIPMHSVGSLLIVSAWQQLPAKAFTETFKKPTLTKISTFFICAVSFIMLDIFGAVIACAIATLILQKGRSVAK